MIAFQDRRPPTPLPALPIPPLAEVEIPPAVAALPKADVHVHAESGARLEQVIVQQTGRPGTDWRAKARELMRDLPPGMARLETWVAGLPYSRSWVDEVDHSPGYLEARIRRVLVEAAADGALLVEVMFGALTILRDDFLDRFAASLAEVRHRFPAIPRSAAGGGADHRRVGRYRIATLPRGCPARVGRAEHPARPL